MNKDQILERIKKLAELCEETEPTFTDRDWETYPATYSYLSPY